MLKTIKLQHILAIMLFMAFSLIMCPKTASASGTFDFDGDEWSRDGIFIITLNAGWDAMILSDNDNNKMQHGFSARISAGINFMYLSILLEQDLGFIEYDPGYELDYEDENIELGGVYKSQKLFKGATFLAYPWYFEVANNDGSYLEGELKLGIGAVYMGTPDFADDDIEAWFGLRPSISLFYVFTHRTTVGFGVEFDYTLAVSDSNCFNNESVLHFITTQAKLLFKF